jgi:hypothetical protein
LAMLAYDKVVVDIRGISWRAVIHDSGTGLFLFKPVCEVTKE